MKEITLKDRQDYAEAFAAMKLGESSPMTTERKLSAMIYGRAVEEEDIKSMMPLIKKEIGLSITVYRITWERPASEYPNAIFNALLKCAKPVILKWFKQNKPNAFQIRLLEKI